MRCDCCSPGLGEGDGKATGQPFREQPGSAGSSKAAHQLAATPKTRSESPPGHSTSLKTSATRFGKIEHTASRDSRHDLRTPAQLRSSMERAGQTGKQRCQLDTLASGAQTPLLCSSTSLLGGVRLMSATPLLRRSTERLRRSEGLPLAREERRVLGWAVQRGTKPSRRAACAFQKKPFRFCYKQRLQIARCLE